MLYYLQIFSDGITNSLVGVIQDDDKANMILVRVFGENTDKFIDRDAELENMKVTHHTMHIWFNFRNILVDSSYSGFWPSTIRILLQWLSLPIPTWGNPDS